GSNPTEILHGIDRSLQLRPHRVVEINIKSLRGSFLQMFQRIPIAIVESVVNLNLFAEKAHFLFRPRAGNHPAMVHPGQTADCASHRSRASRNKHSSTVTQLSDTEQAHPSRHPRHAESS